MRAYGKRKIATRVAGHQRCGVCHPDEDTKVMRARARREGREIATRSCDHEFGEPPPMTRAEQNAVDYLCGLAPTAIDLDDEDGD